MPSSLFVAAALGVVSMLGRQVPARDIPRKVSVGRIGAAERIVINDNRVPAGALRNGVLTVRLQARDGEWHPYANSGLGVVVRAFAADGGAPTVPGPLLRVPVGTEIHAFVQNSTGQRRFYVHGLNTRGAHGTPNDTASIAPGETREFRFTASTVGTFYYWAATDDNARLADRLDMDSQLSGALIVDPISGPPRRDRVFVVTSWGQQAGAQDGGFVINGKSWPHTERLTYTTGDSVRIRMINAGAGVHPMHLHGFYYNVDSRGGEQSDSIFAGKSSPHLVNTERLVTERTFSMTWIPTRDGNWLFHCHDPVHIRAAGGRDGTPAKSDADPSHDHLLDGMSGPVMGIAVLSSRASKAATTTQPRRKLRLIAEVDSGDSAEQRAFGYMLGSDGNRATRPSHPGPTLVLQRGQPVSITVVNRLPEPTSVHWHGIELESYYDGVPGFSGHNGHLAPIIAPHDSFVARFTPVRSGTFMYHPHVSEMRQQQAGLDGVLIVVDSLRAYDPATELVLLVTSSRGAADNPDVYLNGSATPTIHDLIAGVKYRVRLLNLHNGRPSMIVTVMRDSTVLNWRAIAKDGMPLPSDQATSRAARQQIGNGETYDFEFVPSAPGQLRLAITSGAGVPLLSTRIRVK